MARARPIALVAGCVIVCLLGGMGAALLEEATGQGWIKYLILSVIIIPMVILALRSDWVTRRFGRRR